MTNIFTAEQRKVFDFPVKREKLLNPQQHDTGYDAIYRTDSGANLGVVGRGYKLIPHRIAILDVLRQFEENGLPKVEPVRIAASAMGSRLFAEFKFAEKFDLGIASTEDPKVGDLISPGFKIINSYDRSIEYSLSAFLLRLTCTNGMTVTEQLFFDSQRHVAKLEINKMVDSFVEKYGDMRDIVVPAIRNLSDKEVTPSYFENQLNGLPAWFRTEAISYMSDHNLVAMEDGEDGPELVMMKKISNWDFYNSLTYVLSHSDEISEERRNSLGETVSATFGM
ncbi:hypothetical protein LCGC14_1568170 [marine sediment metagenome]|uniref:DUF932 domain-containing protein n=1 Tax=marine sediment metagenome TaxID=412755 RepID=A0A0F9L1M6_9ZZZZ